TLKEGFDDPVALGLLASAKEEGLDRIENVKRAAVFKLKGELERETLDRIARSLFADSITEIYSIDKPVLDENSGSVIEIAFNPGVMDPIEASARKALREMGVDGVEGIKTGLKVLFKGDVERKAIEDFAGGFLYNKVIQHQVREGENPFPVNPPYVFKRETVKLSGLSDSELLEISRKGILSLNIDEMRTIQAYFEAENRDPTDVELETIAQTWSEHCHHKTFRSTFRFGRKKIANLLKSTVMKATNDLDFPWCVSVFKDNAGVISFDGNYDLCFKVETHNHPSALEPYGGAGTGIGGVIRDILGTGLGAKPIANIDVFCFAPPDTPRESLPAGVLHPKRIMKGVVAGVSDYGNRMGIPTVNGAICFHPDFVGNPLVYCGTVGILPKGMHEKGARPGDYVAVIGGRTGRDGIHGATFSSIELDEDTGVKTGGAVQIGNPIEEKRFMDAMLIARDKNLYTAVTDCGAGGFSSAVGEMGEHCGAKVHLERAPLKYEGLAPWEIWVSEAQERMVLAVPPENWDEFKRIMDDWDVECVHLGEFTDTRRLELFYENNQVCDLSMEFLHKGIPPSVHTAKWKPSKAKDPDLAKLLKKIKPGELLKKVLSHWDVCSKEWVIRQYDHEVQGGSSVKPLTGKKNDGPGDAAVIRPVLQSDKACVIANGINVRYAAIDPYHMATAVIDEALRNVVAVGGNPHKTALLDNFSWGSSTDPDRLGELVMASQGCYDAALAFKTPFISGKDSLNNEYRAGDKLIAIPSTLLISAMSVVHDVNKLVTMDAKTPGNLIFIVGITRAHIGGSVILDLFGKIGRSVPEVDLELAPRIFDRMHAAIDSGSVVACHDLSDGGLGVALAEMCFAGGLGCEVELADVITDETVSEPLDDSVILYSESPSRFVVEIVATKRDEFFRIMDGIPAAVIGVFTEIDRLIIRDRNRAEFINEPIEDLKIAWRKPLEW
ncbi:MAG TPA: phosphoribosylformylglycinamidine synthase subunit PurL, partial [Firmicutes bacterium]|nr:phosphoribosylformylglycinamidine synthase subunit PurL [Bacillota bacterium]